MFSNLQIIYTDRETREGKGDQHHFESDVPP